MPLYLSFTRTVKKLLMLVKTSARCHHTTIDNHLRIVRRTLTSLKPSWNTNSTSIYRPETLLRGREYLQSSLAHTKRNDLRRHHRETWDWPQKVNNAPRSVDRRIVVDRKEHGTKYPPPHATATKSRSRMKTVYFLNP